MEIKSVDLLILGAGWTSTFLIPLLRAKKVSFAATTRDGRSVAGADTIKWAFDPDERSSLGNGENQFSPLPSARTILVTFPLTGPQQSQTLVHGYAASHSQLAASLRVIQLGSTGIWQGAGATSNNTSGGGSSSCWVTRHSEYASEGSRAVAEDALLGLGGAVLNLAGLWGGERDPRNWVERVAKTRDEVRAKKSLHMIHGLDVARAVLAVAERWEAARGQRWMLTDGFVYDWWALMAGWADVKREGPDAEPSRQAVWVAELMREEGVRGLPRDMGTLGRCYDSREFWETFRLTPLRARI